MIELYYYTSPNARKVLMMLEEVGLPYEVLWIDISAGDQHSEAYALVNPNRKIPALIDSEGPDGQPLALFESGAILLYLAEKTGRLLPVDPARRWSTIKWLFWQTSSQGPLLGQAAHFVSHAANRGIDVQYAVDRYKGEANRLYGVLESQLKDREYIDGEFSIADIAAFPWVRVAKGQGVLLDHFPNVKRWCDAVAERPSARKKLARDKATREAARTGYYTDETWKVLFGGHAADQSTTSISN
ncbi:glutathione S-transferase [Variovorax sp. WS11]|uniref:glutathione S-transferase family protein n=1 Tax=Variovorax sp. WS11 TaxID=1105204 RepID=UPI000D0CF27B|nr:glutathione S-transferase N-terminal domain-containing protein [Variovorax sp. WS11]NDZ17410.1 glutathione S-transferase [Variovorax sp. WS11]PSL86055.1 glutathione S-transferase [Variovorax sp. WS11]